MKVTLTNWERLWLAMIVGSGQCPSIAVVRLGNCILDRLEMTDGEKAEIGWRQISPSAVAWDRETGWPMEFTNEEWALLRARVIAFQQWPQDRRTEALYDKIVGEDC